MICSQGTCQSLLSVMITDDKKMICSQGTCRSLLSVMITVTLDYLAPTC